MANKRVLLAAGCLIMAALVGCRSERDAAASGAEGAGGPPVPAHVDLARPATDACTKELLPPLLGGIGYEVLRSEASPAGCVVIVEAFADPEPVSDYLVNTTSQLGYASTGNVAAKGGRRLTYTGADDLAISILMRGNGAVTLQHPEAGSHLELHWYNPSLL